MFLRSATVLFLTLATVACSNGNQTASPLFVKNSLTYTGAFYPVTFKQEDVYIGQHRLFINTQSFAVRCDGKPITKLGGFIYITDNSQALIVDEETGAPLTSIPFDEFFEILTVNGSKWIPNPNLISINGTFTNSDYSTKNQCQINESL